MVPTISLPPWLRRIQQSWYWQALALPILTGFIGALILHGCFSNGIEHITHACVMLALNTMGLTMLTAWLKGHSSGSAQFAADGTQIAAVPELKKLIDASAEIKQRAADPADPTPAAAAMIASSAIQSVTKAVEAAHEGLKQHISE